jgi:hypothetical protein
MLAAWEHYARGCCRCLPARSRARLYNNAILLERDLTAGERADTLDAMRAAYETTGIRRFVA